VKISSAPLHTELQISMAEYKIGKNPHLDEIAGMGPFVINQTRTSMTFLLSIQNSFPKLTLGD